MTGRTPPLLYRVRHVDGSPQADAPWAITVQSGGDDPEPRVLAYARAEHIAQRICLALRQSDRLAHVDNVRAATTFAARLAAESNASDDG